MSRCHYYVSLQQHVLGHPASGHCSIPASIMTSPVCLARVASTVASSECSNSINEDVGHVGSPIIEIMVDLKPFSLEVAADERLSSIVNQVQAIGKDAFWGNNCLCDCTKKNGWRLNVAVEPNKVGDEVFGFVVYKIERETMVLHIQYIAVSDKYRRKGIGAKILKALQNYAAKALTVSTVQRIACACVPEAVKFYQKHCFRKVKKIVAAEEEGVVLPETGINEQQIPLQFQMEWKVPDKRKNKAGR